MKATVFERVGGFAKVRRMVSAFYDKILDSDRLRAYFDGVDMRRLIDHQTKMMASLMGGPASFTDEHLARAHVHLRISGKEFDEMAELLNETLEDFSVEESEAQRILAHVVALRPVITANDHVRVG